VDVIAIGHAERRAYYSDSWRDRSWRVLGAKEQNAIQNLVPPGGLELGAQGASRDGTELPDLTRFEVI
jgi:hypothetical protein